MSNSLINFLGMIFFGSFITPKGPSYKLVGARSRSRPKLREPSQTRKLPPLPTKRARRSTLRSIGLPASKSRRQRPSSANMYFLSFSYSGIIAAYYDMFIMHNLEDKAEDTMGIGRERIL